MRRYKSGIYIPQAGKCKYTKQAKFRSSYEHALIMLLEHSNVVQTWEYENMWIGYQFAGRSRQYLMDFTVTLTNGERFLLEVKPLSMYRRAFLAGTADMNYCKWQAAMNFAATHNYKFKVVTEVGLRQLRQAWK